MDTENINSEYHAPLVIVLYKYISGVIETTLGLSVLFLGNQIIRYYEKVKIQELLEDPHDLFVRLIETILPYVLKHREYVAMFLILFGVTKIVGAVGLTFHKSWGLDVLIVFGIILLPFDFTELIIHPSVLRVLYILINILIVLYLMNFRPRDYVVEIKGRMGLNGK